MCKSSDGFRFHSHFSCCSFEMERKNENCTITQRSAFYMLSPNLAYRSVAVIMVRMALLQKGRPTALRCFVIVTVARLTRKKPDNCSISNNMSYDNNLHCKANKLFMGLKPTLYQLLCALSL